MPPIQENRYRAAPPRRVRTDFGAAGMQELLAGHSTKSPYLGTHAVRQKLHSGTALTMRPAFDFLSNGGAMGALMRAHDWAATPLGVPAQWPESLKTTLRLVLTSKHPMFIWWGPDLIQFYNDAYRQTMGQERHPAALGQAGRDCWAEIWDMIGPQIDSIMAGGDASWHEDQLVPVTRHGRLEDVWWTYGFSPVEDGEGVRGVLVVCNDVSKDHNSRAELLRLNQQLLEQIALREAVERRQAFQLTLADRLRGLEGTDDIARTATELLGKHLQVSHVYYTSLDEKKGIFHIHHEWKLDNLPALAGVRGELARFDPEILAALRNGQIFSVGDTTLDPRTAPYTAAYASLGARACLVVPVIKAGQLVAALTLHQSSACDWPSNQVALAEDVADRIWNAVERAGHALLVQQVGESERLYALFRQAPWFMYILRGPEHAFEFVNAAFVHMVGARKCWASRSGQPSRKWKDRAFSNTWTKSMLPRSRSWQAPCRFNCTARPAPPPPRFMSTSCASPCSTPTPACRAFLSAASMSPNASWRKTPWPFRARPCASWRNTRKWSWKTSASASPATSTTSWDKT